MTTTSIVEHLGVERRSGNRIAHRTTSNPTVEGLRAESHAALTHILVALGYPPHWADELERRAFGAGRVWSGAPVGEGRALRG